MKGEHFFLIILILNLVFGSMLIFTVYQSLRQDNPAKVKYEYEAIKSYFGLSNDTASRLIYGSSLKANIRFVEAASLESETIFKVANAGDIPLTGFTAEADAFVIQPAIVPFILPPGYEGVIILENKDIDGKGAIVFSTDQGAAVRISR